jgi:iron(III) transport system permease protein
VSLTAACAWTLGRSLVVPLLTVLLAAGLRRRLGGLGRRSRLVFWTLLLVPFFTPALLTGFAYAKFSLALVRHPEWNEALYAALLVARFVPVGMLILAFTPPAPVSAAALYCARLRARGIAGILGRVRFLAPFALRGPLRELLPALAIVFLLAFQEFETASLMATASWTVWLFDAQAGGLLLSESLRRAVLPAACEVLVVGLFAVYAVRGRLLPAARPQQTAPVSRGRDAAAWLTAIAACVAVTGVPLAVVGRDVRRGMAFLLESRQMLEEIAIATGFGLAAGLSAALLAAGLRRCCARRAAAGVTAALCFAAALPGLMGSLIVSLLVLWLFQRPPLAFLYDTTFPAVAALVLYLLPRALLLQLVVGAATPRPGLHLARLLEAAPEAHRRARGGELAWRLARRNQFLAAGILCIWGYLELTPVAILAPPGVTSAPVRLYNLMHYGRSYVVSAMTLLAMAVPPLLLLVAGALRRGAASFQHARTTGQR